MRIYKKIKKNCSASKAAATPGMRTYICQLPPALLATSRLDCSINFANCQQPSTPNLRKKTFQGDDSCSHCCCYVFYCGGGGNSPSQHHISDNRHPPSIEKTKARCRSQNQRTTEPSQHRRKGERERERDKQRTLDDRTNSRTPPSRTLGGPASSLLGVCSSLPPPGKR